jgi:hypothetical protein
MKWGGIYPINPIGTWGEDNFLSEDYGSVLQSNKDTEQQLSEIEKKNHKYHTEAMSKLNELRSANTTKMRSTLFSAC